MREGEEGGNSFSPERCSSLSAPCPLRLHTSSYIASSPPQVRPYVPPSSPSSAAHAPPAAPSGAACGLFPGPSSVGLQLAQVWPSLPWPS